MTVIIIPTMYAVIGTYGDHSGIERLEFASTKENAKLIIQRWLAQNYSGIINVWEHQPFGAAIQVSIYEFNNT